MKPNYNYNNADSLALTVPCPLCHAEEDMPCVYVWPKGVRECAFTWDHDPTLCTAHSKGQHERLAKVGMPTKITHNERKSVVFKRSVRQKQLEEKKRLVEWLRRYGDIFKEGGIG